MRERRRVVTCMLCWCRYEPRRDERGELVPRGAVLCGPCDRKYQRNLGGLGVGKDRPEWGRHRSSEEDRSSIPQRLPAVGCAAGVAHINETDESEGFWSLVVREYEEGR